MGKNILVFPWRDWNQIKRDGFRTREANILREMIEDVQIDKILCINRSTFPRYLIPVLKVLNKENLSFSYNDISDYKEKYIYKRAFSNLKVINDKLYILDIKYHLPNPKGNKLERYKIFDIILKKEVEFANKYLKMDNHLSWCFDLTRVETANYFKSNILIFDAIDNLLEHDQNKVDYKFLKDKYNYVAANADIVFTVSEALKKGLFSKKASCYHVPNGINLDLYRKNTIYNRPNDLPQNNKPIVGYIGLMQERIDIDLLENSIKRNPQVNFVFIGPILTPSYFKGIMNYENTYFLGAKRHDVIPSYLSFFNIGIIPHKVNKFTKSMNPLKLYEYLAAGNQVISTPVPPTEKFENLIYIAKTSEQFSDLIKFCVENPYKKANREEIVYEMKSHSWNARYNEMKSLLKDLM